MELSIGKAALCPSTIRRQQRANRAKWWFQRMRQAVDKAFDWNTPPARPEQIWFPE